MSAWTNPNNCFDMIQRWLICKGKVNYCNVSPSGGCIGTLNAKSLGVIKPGYGDNPKIRVKLRHILLTF